MSKEIIFSRAFPGYHRRAGEPTYFVEKYWSTWKFRVIGIDYKVDYFNDLYDLNKHLPFLMVSNFKSTIDAGIFQNKNTTIRAGKRWKVGDLFTPKVWSGLPYRSKKIIIGPEAIVVNVYDFEISNGSFFIAGREYDGEVEAHFELLDKLALNDGLSRIDLMSWFKYPNPFSGQIICWNENVIY